jgi:hypothetical protein
MPLQMGDPMGVSTMREMAHSPTCGVLSKSKVLLWKAIEEKVLHVMSEASFVAKIEASRRRLDDIECQLKDLNTSVITTEDDIT